MFWHLIAKKIGCRRTRYNIQAKEGEAMAAICCQKNLKRALGRLYPGKGFIGDDYHLQRLKELGLHDDEDDVNQYISRI